MIQGKKYDPKKTDTWSAGITLFTMLTGNLPFKDKDLSHLYKKIVNESFKAPIYLSLEAFDLINRLLIKDPNKRLDFKSIKEHPWMQKFKPNTNFNKKSKKVNFFLIFKIDEKLFNNLLDRWTIDKKLLKFYVEKEYKNPITTL